NDSIEKLVDFTYSAAFGLIQPGQVRSEILQLAGLVQKHQPRTVVEIGTARGGTLFIWSKLAHPEAVIASIDLPGGIHGGGYPLWKTFLYRRFAGRNQRVCLIRANSQSPGTVQKLKSVIGSRKIDFLFIDGDHTYDGVRADFQNYSPLVSPNGMIAFHDVCFHSLTSDCRVDVFWREIRNKYRHVEFIKDSNQGWAGIGVLLLQG
ncbi:MAG: class I SAM-dependent methyltransferase, partial [Verrucomicrobiota bacterium]